jgi:hypothetical protein
MGRPVVHEALGRLTSISLRPQQGDSGVSARARVVR